MVQEIELRPCSGQEAQDSAGPEQASHSFLLPLMFMQQFCSWSVYLTLPGTGDISSKSPPFTSQISGRSLGSFF